MPYDGHQTIVGMSGANPEVVPRNFASRAVNRFFRYDTNDSRLPFREIELEFETEQDRKLFRGGNMQGGFFYNAFPSFQIPYLIFSVAGTIYRVRIIGKKGYVYKLFEGNEPVFTHAWMSQAFEWLCIQDGTARPILWDGVNAARRAVAGEVPTGSVMAFIHGRWAVASSDGTNQIAVGDIVYGSQVTNTSDVIKFTETEYWAEGGAFGAPVYVGDIMGMYAMPYLDTGTGQNELVVPGTEGVVSLDLSGPRESWIDKNPLRISLPKGAGCASSHSLCGFNGDLLYRGIEGVRSYKNARIEFQQSWKQTPISSDVRRWLDRDAQWLLQYCSMATWRNLMLCTTQPMVQQANNPFAGHHRFHRGLVVLDAQPESNTLREGASVWHGLWTGIRPVFFIEGRIEQNHRCFALSYDCDGRNRLYEVEPEGLNDVHQGAPKKIVSFYDTPVFGTIEAYSNNFDLKKLTGGVIDLSNLKQQVEAEIKFRPDGSACNMTLHDFDAGCECKTSGCNQSFTQPRPHKEHFLSAEDAGCVPGTDKTAAFQYWSVFRVKIEGRAIVDRMRVRFEKMKDEEVVECGPDNCEPIQCCDQDEFEYHLAECGENTEIPDIPIPSDVVQTFTATRTYVAPCPRGTTGMTVTRTCTATSTVSQEDANAKAVACARAQAEAELECAPCEPVVLIDFVSNSSTTDLSAFFATGLYLHGDSFRPWRLIETVTEIVYASGYIDNTGTLIIVFVLEGYTTYLDALTKEFIDGGITDAFMSLQLGCNPDSWPNSDVYLSP
jgi:hypothetical protein